jgi:hypothetical protein
MSEVKLSPILALLGLAPLFIACGAPSSSSLRAEVNKSRSIGLLRGWAPTCPFPPKADIDTAIVSVRVTVQSDGTPSDASIVSDPGHGFGAVARTCALAWRYLPALDRNGTPVPSSEIVHVRFDRTGASAAPEPRLSEPLQIDRWKAAIESYVPIVRFGNTAPLGVGRRPFAEYLVAMHARLHPIFADQFLPTLGSAWSGNPLSTHLEIVLEKGTGKVVRMGVTKTSGLILFDIGALEAVERASPFGTAPDIIASPDGNVYVHWEFHRDPQEACSTRNARPYLLMHAP